MFEWFKKKPVVEEDDETKAILAFIDELLKDKEINTVLPDVLEKKLYLNMFKMLFAMLEHMSESVKIDFLNHTLTLKLSPKVPE